VTSRNAPSVINAVFSLRNFWDGHASNLFNSATPFGSADARATVLVASGSSLQPQAVRLDGSSLASQAAGPPLNGLEMSYEGRAWADLGRKMLARMPLARQAVARDDSMLGQLADAAGSGLRSNITYSALIRGSFQPADWSSPAVVNADGRVIVADGEPARSGEFNRARSGSSAPASARSRTTLAPPVSTPSARRCFPRPPAGARMARSSRRTFATWS
jgi:hypothetical protein